ncbi:MAG: PHP domain-containing protein [Propionibacteriaceae bacterium]
MRIDLHTHSSVSDGTVTPTELVAQAKAVDLDVIALCDHDTFAGLDEASDAGTLYGVTVLPGIELSCKVRGTSIHMLGYGCHRDNHELQAELDKIQESRRLRIPLMAAQLSALGFPITAAEIEAQAGGVTIGRPHIADALVAKGYVADRREAFDRYLADDGPVYVERYETDLEHAIAIIHRAGGVAVIAHPWGRSSREVLPLDYLELLAKQCHLDGIEIFHTDHDEATRETLAAWAQQHDLVWTGSSDYHGAGKPDNPLGINVTDPAQYQAILALIATRGGTLPTR